MTAVLPLPASSRPSIPAMGMGWDGRREGHRVGAHSAGPLAHLEKTRAIYHLAGTKPIEMGLIHASTAGRDGDSSAIGPTGEFAPATSPVRTLASLIDEHTSRQSCRYIHR